METAEKYSLLLQKGSVPFVALLQKARKPIVMFWYFPTLSHRVIPVALPSVALLIIPSSRSLSWMDDWFIKPGHWADRQFGMEEILRAGRSPAVFILL